MIAIGSRALLGNAIGYNNTAIGSCALLCNTMGYNNTAIDSSYNPHSIMVMQLHSIVHIGQISLMHFQLWDNEKKHSFVLTLSTNHKDPRLVYGNFMISSSNYYTMNQIEGAFDIYKIQLPKWLLLYKFFVKDNHLGCIDIFSHLIKYYPITQTP